MWRKHDKACRQKNNDSRRFWKRRESPHKHITLVRRNSWYFADQNKKTLLRPWRYEKSGCATHFPRNKNHHFCKQKVSVLEYNSWPRCSFSNRRNLSCSSLGPSSAFFPNKMPGTPILKLQPKTSRPTFQISLFWSCQRKSDTISKNCCTSLPSQ